MLFKVIVCLVVGTVAFAFKMGIQGHGGCRRVTRIGVKADGYTTDTVKSFKVAAGSGVDPSTNLAAMKNLAESGCAIMKHVQIKEISSYSSVVQGLFNTFSCLDWVSGFGSEDDAAQFSSTQPSNMLKMGSAFVDNFADLKLENIRYRGSDDGMVKVIQPHHLWALAKHRGIIIEGANEDEELGEVLKVGKLLLSKTDLVTFTEKVKVLMAST